MLHTINVLQTIRKGEWFTSEDLRDTFFHIPISALQRQCLHFFEATSNVLISRHLPFWWIKKRASCAPHSRPPFLGCPWILWQYRRTPLLSGYRGFRALCGPSTLGQIQVVKQPPRGSTSPHVGQNQRYLQVSGVHTLLTPGKTWGKWGSSPDGWGAV